MTNSIDLYGDDIFYNLFDGTYTSEVSDTFEDSEITAITGMGFRLRNAKTLRHLELPNLASHDWTNSGGSLSFLGYDLSDNTGTYLRLPKFNGVSGGSNGYLLQACGYETVILDSVTELARGLLQNSKITTLILPKGTKTGTYSLSGCSNLTTLVLGRSAGICVLSAVGNISGTPFASGGSGGTIYVPSALIETYKTATNWSTVYGYGTVNFVAIEGSLYEEYKT